MDAAIKRKRPAVAAARRKTNRRFRNVMPKYTANERYALKWIVVSAVICVLAYVAGVMCS